MQEAASIRWEVRPPYPPDGKWKIPVREFAPRNVHITPGVGTPTLVQFFVDDATWIASFPQGGGLAEVSRLGDSTWVLVVGEQGFAIDVSSPDDWEEVDVWPVEEECAVEGTQQRLVWDWISIASVGPGGVTWCSERLCLDDLEIIRVSEDRIICRGTFRASEETEEFVLDAASGRQISGPRFEDFG